MIDELTEREKQARNFACAGLTNREVAVQMSVKESTVKQYLHRVYDKLAGPARSAGRACRSDLDCYGESRK